MTASITSRTFGFLPTGECVTAWLLTGQGGLQLEVLAYGGTVSRLLAPDRDGRLEDVVLGYDNLESYLTCHAYLGGIVGRVAGRMTGGRFSIDGKLYRLALNDSPNHLHGGITGFNRRLWAGTPLAQTDQGVSLQLTYTSPCGEEGYPGTMCLTITYTVTAENIFRIETIGVTDAPTPLSLTHHSYFNLAGEGTASISGHDLHVSAGKFVPVDAQMTLTGRLEPVDAANDFRKPRGLAQSIPQLYRNHGDLYRLRSAGEDVPGNPMCLAARLIDPDSGRVLQVSTTEQYLQLYTGASLNGGIGKSGKRYEAFAGLCLECMGYPDGIDVPELGSILVQPGERCRQTTEYAFSTCSASAATSDRYTNETSSRN